LPWPVAVAVLLVSAPVSAFPRNLVLLPLVRVERGPAFAQPPNPFLGCVRRTEETKISFTVHSGASSKISHLSFARSVLFVTQPSKRGAQERQGFSLVQSQPLHIKEDTTHRSRRTLDNGHLALFDGGIEMLHEISLNIIRRVIRKREKRVWGGQFKAHDSLHLQLNDAQTRGSETRDWRMGWSARKQR